MKSYKDNSAQAAINDFYRLPLSDRVVKTKEVINAVKEGAVSDCICGDPLFEYDRYCIACGSVNPEFNSEKAEPINCEGSHEDILERYQNCEVEEGRAELIQSYNHCRDCGKAIVMA